MNKWQTLFVLGMLFGISSDLGTLKLAVYDGPEWAEGYKHLFTFIERAIAIVFLIAAIVIWQRTDPKKRYD